MKSSLKGATLRERAGASLWTHSHHVAAMLAVNLVRGLWGSLKDALWFPVLLILTAGALLLFPVIVPILAWRNRRADRKEMDAFNAFLVDRARDAGQREPAETF